MKNLKRIIVLALIILMALMAYTGCQRQTAAGAAGGRPSVPQGSLVVGVNAMNGDMFTGWSNLVANANTKDMIYGYGTVMYTDNDEFLTDPVVVKSFNTTNNSDGGKTYTIEINNNLTYNDGTRITAKDYVFALLFNCSPQLRELGANRWTSYGMYQGFQEYNTGASNLFSGINLLGEYTFSITVAPVDRDGDPTFPFWYEITYANVVPLPLHVLAPGCDVVDNGRGAEITGPYTLQLLQSTVDNGSTGYRYNPKVTSGPYNFVSYDASAYMITLEANDKYLGSGPEKEKPYIKTLILYQVSQATAVDALGAGTIDLLIQHSGGEFINQGLNLVDAGKADYITYSRNGFGKITFHCDWGPTQFAEVRRAIAYSMDREAFVRLYTGGFGIIVHSRIGSAQWMLADNRAALDRDLTVYTLNLQKAREELEAGGWTLNATGGAYTTGTRYKRMPDGSLMALVIEWFSPDSNAIGEMLSTFITDNARSVGMEIRQEWGDSTAFGNAIYGTGNKRYNMMNGGSGFNVQDSPWYYYTPERDTFADRGGYNTNFVADVELNRYTQEMKNTTPGDRASFSRSWLNFAKRFNLILPDLPLYSDEYYDFFNPKLKGFSHNALYPWTSAIINAWVE